MMGDQTDAWLEQPGNLERWTKGPKEGVKFLISDAGDLFTVESKKLKESLKKQSGGA